MHLHRRYVLYIFVIKEIQSQLALSHFSGRPAATFRRDLLRMPMGHGSMLRVHAVYELFERLVYYSVYELFEGTTGEDERVE